MIILATLALILLSILAIPIYLFARLVASLITIIMQR
jgi:hypothetical protein